MKSRQWVWLLSAVACTPPEVRGVGQFGRPIPLVANEDMIPRLLVNPFQQKCPGTAGACSSFYDGPPSLHSDGSCSLAVLDTGTVLSTMAVAPRDRIQLARQCLEIRSGQGSESGTFTDLAQTVTRFRFEQLPLFRVPTTSQLDELWRAGDEETAFVGGVIGANLLRNFAIRFRHVPSLIQDSPGRSTVQFYVLFPGSEIDLANQGLAFIRTQYPNRLLGRQSGDRCSLGPNIDCKIDQLFELDAQDEQQVYESSRMVLDTCIAPPPCGVYYGAFPGQPSSCIKNSTNPFNPDSPVSAADLDSCTIFSSGVPNEGYSASMIPVTSISGAVLFSDSFARMFGPSDNIPLCDVVLETRPETRVCRESFVRTIHLPGWPALTPELTLRIRSMALVSGLRTASGSSPCHRLSQRMEGLLKQCEAYSSEKKPTLPPSPEANTTMATAKYDTSAFVVGDAYGFGTRRTKSTKSIRGTTESTLNRWISTAVVSSASQLARSIRADVSGIAIEPDGLIGSAILRNNDVVFDYTEEEADPGIRARCLQPEDGSCVSIPVCREKDNVGYESCCFGLPQNLLKGVIQTNQASSQTCCTALSSRSLAELQAEAPSVCLGIEPP